MNTHSNRGLWEDIQPNKLSKKDLDHPWVFASLWEFPSMRDDDCYYIAFLFRNKERTIFGIKEYTEISTEITKKNFRRFATLVIQDKEFRESLISSDPDLPTIWKRH